MNAASVAGFEILLVEDNDFDAKRVTRALSRIDRPYRLHRAVNGQDALDKLRHSLRQTPNQRLIDPQTVLASNQNSALSDSDTDIDSTVNIAAPAIRRPFIILLDLNMPVMGGLGFLEELRSDPQLCKSVVVVMTTSEFYKDVETAHSFNVSGYVVKPVSGGEMIELIRRVIDFFEKTIFPK